MIGPAWLWWVDAAVAMSALVLAVRGAHRRRRELGPQARLLMLGLHMTLLVIALGSVEAISQGAPVGVRNYGVIVASGWVILGVTWNTRTMVWLRARLERTAGWLGRRCVRFVNVRRSRRNPRREGRP